MRCNTFTRGVLEPVGFVLSPPNSFPSFLLPCQNPKVIRCDHSGVWLVIFMLSIDAKISFLNAFASSIFVTSYFYYLLLAKRNKCSVWLSNIIFTFLVIFTEEFSSNNGIHLHKNFVERRAPNEIIS